MEQGVRVGGKLVGRLSIGAGRPVWGFGGWMSLSCGDWQFLACEGYLLFSSYVEGIIVDMDC